MLGFVAYYSYIYIHTDRYIATVRFVSPQTLTLTQRYIVLNFLRGEIFLSALVTMQLLEIGFHKSHVVPKPYLVYPSCPVRPGAFKNIVTTCLWALNHTISHSLQLQVSMAVVRVFVYMQASVQEAR